ncbi:MAG: hypothetical protein NTZ05_04185 [Chloroflexi bacterium]|nr:hypothetical protein [Chloroflexota bacterium]
MAAQGADQPSLLDELLRSKQHLDALAQSVAVDQARLPAAQRENLSRYLGVAGLAHGQANPLEMPALGLAQALTALADAYPSVARFLLATWMQLHSDAAVLATIMLRQHGIEPNTLTGAESSRLAADLREGLPTLSFYETELALAWLNIYLDTPEPVAPALPEDDGTVSSLTDLLPPRLSGWLVDLAALGPDAPEWRSLDVFAVLLQGMAEAKRREALVAAQQRKLAVTLDMLTDLEAVLPFRLGSAEWSAKRCPEDRFDTAISTVEQMALLLQHELDERLAAAGRPLDIEEELRRGERRTAVLRQLLVLREEAVGLLAPPPASVESDGGGSDAAAAKEGAAVDADAAALLSA